MWHSATEAFTPCMWQRSFKSVRRLSSWVKNDCSSDYCTTCCTVNLKTHGVKVPAVKCTNTAMSQRININNRIWMQTLCKRWSENGPNILKSIKYLNTNFYCSFFTVSVPGLRLKNAVIYLALMESIQKLHQKKRSMHARLRKSSSSNANLFTPSDDALTDKSAIKHFKQKKQGPELSAVITGFILI